MSLIVCGAQHCYKYLKGEWHPIYMDKQQRGREILELIVHVIAGVLAAGIAWKRMGDQNTLLKLLVAIVAFMFGMLYLVYVVGTIALGDADDDNVNEYKTAMATALQGGDMDY